MCVRACAYTHAHIHSIPFFASSFLSHLLMTMTKKKKMMSGCCCLMSYLSFSTSLFSSFCLQKHEYLCEYKHVYIFS